MRKHYTQFRASRFSLKERRLCFEVGSAERMSQRMVEVLKEDGADVQAQLQELMLKVKDDEQSEIFASVRTRLESLKPEELAQITKNLESLNLSTVETTTKKKLDALKAAISAPRTSGAERKGVVQQVKGFVSDRWQEASAWWKGVNPETRSKVGIGASVVIGAGALYMAGRWLFGRGKKRVQAANNEGKAAAGEVRSNSLFGTIKKAFVYSTVAGLTIFGLKKAADYVKGKFTLAGLGGSALKQYQTMMASMQEQVFGMFNARDEQYSKLKEGVEELRTSKWAKYGLTENEYNRAISIVQKNPDMNVAMPKLRKIFGLAEGETSSEFQLFIKDQERENMEYTSNGITYRNLEKAQQTYESTFKVILSHVQEWIEKNSVATTVGTLLAYKIGLLQRVLRAPGSVFKRSFAVGRLLSRVAGNHPVVSLLLVGGAVGTALAAKREMKGALVPEDMSALLTALADNKPLFIDAQSKLPIDVPVLNSVQGFADSAMELLDDTGALAGKLADATGELLSAAWNLAPEKIRLDEYEYLVQRNSEGFEDLWTEIGRWEDSLDGSAGSTSKEYEKLSKVKMSLLAFEAVFFEERSGTVFQPTERSQQLFVALQDAMRAAGMNMHVYDGIVQWKSRESDELKHLCISPEITDSDKALDVANNMNFGESFLDNYFYHTVAEIRMEQLETDDVAMMVVGNFVFFYSNIGHYVKCHIDVAKSWYEHGLASEEFARALGTATGASVLISTQTILPTAVKRFLYGGPKMSWPGTLGVAKKGLKFLVPGAHPVSLAIDALRGEEDIIEFSRIYRMSRKQGVAKSAAKKLAKEAVRAYTNSGLRPRWIRMAMRGGYRQRWLALHVMSRSSKKSFATLFDLLEKGRIKGEYTAFNRDLQSSVVSRFADHVEGGADVVFQRIMGSVGTNPNTSSATTSSAATATDAPGLRVVPPDSEVVDPKTSGKLRVHAQDSDLVRRFEQTVEEMDSLFKNKRFARLLKDANIKPEEARRLLSALEDIDPGTFSRIRGSRQAQNMVVGALITKNASEIATAIQDAQQAARMWPKIMRGMAGTLNVAGAIGDVFGIVMAFVDWQRNNEKIRTTENPYLKEIYSNAKIVYVADGATSTAALAYGGMVMYTSGSVTAAGSLVMLPIALAVMAQRGAYHTLEESAEYHTLNENDLLRFSPGKVLEHIDSSKPGERLWGQVLADWYPTSWFDEPVNWGNANEQARGEGYRAYFAQVAVKRVSVSVLDMSPAELHQLKDNPEQLQKRLRVLQQNANAKFVLDAVRFVQQETNGTFTSVTADTLRRAELYAFNEFEQSLTDGDEYQAPNLQNLNGFTTARTEAYALAQKHRESMQATLVNLSESPEAFLQQAPALLMQYFRHDLATFERRILKTDYDDWNNWTSNEDFQAYVRGFTVDRIKDLILSYQYKKLTSERASALIGDIEAVLMGENLNAEAKRAWDKKKANYYNRIGQNGYLLTPDLVSSYVKRYTEDAIADEQARLGAEEAIAEAKEEDKLWRENEAPKVFTEALAKAESAKGTFVPIGTMFMKVEPNGELVMYNPPQYSSGPSITAGNGASEEKSGITTYRVTKSDIHRMLWTKNKEHALRFYSTNGVEANGRYKVWYYGDSWLMKPENAKYRRMVDEVTQQPVFGNRFDVERIIDMFPSDVYIPGSFNFIRNRQNYRQNVLNVLVPMYENIADPENRETFLVQLRARIRHNNNGHITADAADDIIQWFRNNKRSFGLD